MINVLEAQSLGKRYGRTWALRGCSLAVPAGRVVALVGPNGAGKTTLLHLAVGLTRSTTGGLAVLDNLVPGSPEALSRVGFVAQDTPLYPNLSVADTLRLVANLSVRFDVASVTERLFELGIPLKRKIGKLSGGQHAQVALAVALARHPELLVLDEPVARLDPLARHDFSLATLMSGVVEDGISVVLSSHVVAELERVCDYLVVMAKGEIQVAGGVDELLEAHRVLIGPSGDAERVAARYCVVGERRAERQTHLLIRGDSDLSVPPGWRAEETNLEEMVLAYLRAPDAHALPGPSTASPVARREIVV